MVEIFGSKLVKDGRRNSVMCLVDWSTDCETMFVFFDLTNFIVEFKLKSSSFKFDSGTSSPPPPSSKKIISEIGVGVGVGNLSSMTSQRKLAKMENQRKENNKDDWLKRKITAKKRENKEIWLRRKSTEKKNKVIWPRKENHRKEKKYKETWFKRKAEKK